MTAQIAERLMPQNMPTFPPSNLPGDVFRWQDTGGVFHRVDQMVTRHLFYTVRMIWNHTMPPEAQSPWHRRYTFDPFYTQDYMLRAIAAMCPELLRRTDLTPYQQAEVERWMAYFHNRIGSSPACLCGQCLALPRAL